MGHCTFPAFILLNTICILWWVISITHLLLFPLVSGFHQGAYPGLTTAPFLGDTCCGLLDDLLLKGQSSWSANCSVYSCRLYSALLGSSTCNVIAGTDSLFRVPTWHWIQPCLGSSCLGTNFCTSTLMPRPCGHNAEPQFVPFIRIVSLMVATFWGSVIGPVSLQTVATQHFDTMGQTDSVLGPPHASELQGQTLPGIVDFQPGPGVMETLSSKDVESSHSWWQSFRLDRSSVVEWNWVGRGSLAFHHHSGPQGDFFCLLWLNPSSVMSSDINPVRLWTALAYINHQGCTRSCVAQKEADLLFQPQLPFISQALNIGMQTFLVICDSVKGNGLATQRCFKPFTTG